MVRLGVRCWFKVRIMVRIRVRNKRLKHDSYKLNTCQKHLKST